LRYRVIFELTPEGLFGVPQEGTTVVPAEVHEFFSDTFTNTARKIGHGTLSQYRSPDDALRMDLDFGSCTARIEDNFITISIEADDHSTAYQRTIPPLESLLAHLAVDLRHTLSYRPIEMRDAEERPYPVPLRLDVLQLTQYKLDQVADALTIAATIAALADPTLDRALHYFEHALFLFARRRDLAPPLSRHYRTIISAVFLNLWKAVTTIVGDPSRDRDYQRRYRRYGMDRIFFQTKIERLRELRNDYDVAHYALTTVPSAEIEAVYGEAVSIAAEVIRHYRDHLAELTATN
jgi:hypothetical protein